MMNRAIQERLDALAKLPPRNAADIWNNRKKLPFVPTFSKKLNGILGGGLRATGTYILAGGPGAGKTTVTLDIVHSSISFGQPVVYISAELTDQLVIARYASKQLGMGWLETLDTEDEDKLSKLQSFAEGLGNYLWVLTPAQSIRYQEHIKAIRESLTPGWQEYMKSKGTPVPKDKLIDITVIVDYIQDLAAPRVALSGDPRLAIAELSRELRMFANEQFIPMWIISSTSRAHYAAKEETSMESLIGSAKDAGEVEYDSNAVMHIRKRNAKNFTGIELVVAKNRFGAPFQSVVFEINPVSGELKETNQSAGELVMAVLIANLIKLLENSPFGYYKTIGTIAQALEADNKSVGKALKMLETGQDGYKVVKSYQGNDGYFLFKPVPAAEAK